LERVLLSLGSFRTLFVRFLSPFDCARCRILLNDSVKFLHFGHRCASSTSPCGSVPGPYLIRSGFLSISTHLTRRILVLSPGSRIKPPAPGLIKGRHLQPTFSIFLCFAYFLLLRDRLATNRACRTVNHLVVSCTFMILFRRSSFASAEPPYTSPPPTVLRFAISTRPLATPSHLSHYLRLTPPSLARSRLFGIAASSPLELLPNSLARSLRPSSLQRQPLGLSDPI